KFAKKALDFFKPRMHLTIDTIVQGEGFEIPIRIYYPSKKSKTTPSQIILYIHGGGFVHGSIEDYDMSLKKFARITNRIMVSVDYRLAPEYPYPAGLNDADCVLKWLSHNSSNLGGSSKKIILIGDSAGANLATVLTLKNRDEGNDIINGQILFYPPTTFAEVEFPSRIYFLRDEKRNYILTEEFILKAKNAYIPDSVDERHPYLSPLEAKLNGKLPPLLMVTAQIDPLRDEGKLYAEKFREAGNDVKYVEYKGITHGFLSFYMIFKEAKQAMKMADSFIDKCCENKVD
nr:alpha/beta hydrolase [Bacteroidales bacterium]